MKTLMGEKAGMELGPNHVDTGPCEDFTLSLRSQEANR